MTTVSTFNVQNIVSSLMSAQQQPLTALNTKKTNYNNILKAYGTIQSDVSSLQSAAAALKSSSAFAVFKATSADTTLLSATADSTAVAGNYTITVNNFASAQTLKSANQASITTGIGNAATVLNLQVGTGAAVAVNIGANSTLEQVRDAVNAANTGVSATIVSNGAGYNLVYTASNTGAANTISATTADGALGAIASSASMTQTAAAADASLSVNGVAVTSASNTVTGAVQGVSMNLTKTAGMTTLSVARDFTSIESTINTFISAYNKFNTDFKSNYVKGGMLEADTTVLSIQSQISGALNTATGFSATGGYDYLAQVGITRQTDGSMSLDKATFESKLNTNLSGVIQLFTDATNGVATKIYNQSSQMLGIGGLITSRKDGLNSSITDTQSRIDALNIRLDAIQKRLTNQYTALNSMIQSMNDTSSFMTQQGW
jgi:flagellar hook-associated protein 2